MFNLKGHFSFSYLSMILVLCLLYMPFIMLRYVSSMPTFCKFFIINRWWILLYAFSASVYVTIQFLYFILIMWCITLICRCGINPFYHGVWHFWDGWLASLTRWTWGWVNSRSWWWTGRPGMLRFIRLQRVRHDGATELNWTNDTFNVFLNLIC